MFVCCFTSHSRIFHSYGDVTICRWRASNFGLCSALTAIEQWGFFYVPTPTVTRDLDFYCLIRKTGNQPAASTTRSHDQESSALPHWARAARHVWGLVEDRYRAYMYSDKTCTMHTYMPYDLWHTRILCFRCWIIFEHTKCTCIFVEMTMFMTLISLFSILIAKEYMYNVVTWIKIWSTCSEIWVKCSFQQRWFVRKLCQLIRRRD